MADNTSYTKFGFDNDFFELNVAGFAPGQNRTELLEQARAEGYAAGLAEAQKKAAADLVELQGRLTKLTEQLSQAQKDWETTSTRQLLTLWHRTLVHMLGQAAQHYPEALLEQHLKSLLPLIRTGEDLTLRLNPLARQYHEKLGLPHAHIGGHDFRIIDDPALPPTDCVVEWLSGGMEAKLAKHQEAIATLLAGAGAEPSAPLDIAPPIPPASPAHQAQAAVKTRAAELLGDDELVDALK